jgi:hypothetical protein
MPLTIEKRLVKSRWKPDDNPLRSGLFDYALWTKLQHRNELVAFCVGIGNIVFWVGLMSEEKSTPQVSDPYTVAKEKLTDLGWAKDETRNLNRGMMVYEFWFHPDKKEEIAVTISGGPHFCFWGILTMEKGDGTDSNPIDWIGKG